MAKKARITSKQKSARRRNMAIARAARKPKKAGGGLKAIMRHAKHNAPNLKWLKGNPKAKVKMIKEVNVFYQ